MLDENLIVNKSYNFSLMIIELYKFLSSEKKEYVLSKQLLRCGTSIGANVQEALETRYWINLLIDSGYISKDKEKTQKILNEIESIIKILTKIIKSSQGKKIEKK